MIDLASAVLKPLTSSSFPWYAKGYCPDVPKRSLFAGSAAQVSERRKIHYALTHGNKYREAALEELESFIQLLLVKSFRIILLRNML